MRVSERQRYHISNQRVDGARQKNERMMEQISTLKRINRVSDDPIGMSQLIRKRDHAKNIEQYQTNVEFSKGFLEKTESAVAGLADNLGRAHVLAIGLANDTYDGSSRKAAANEVKQLMNEIVNLSNRVLLGSMFFQGLELELQQ